MTNEGLSLVDVAEIILTEAKEPINIYDIFDTVCTKKGIPAEAKPDLISQFYSDITVSAKFVYVGENTWDLKTNQKIELWEKDGSFYKEYTEVEVPEEYLEKPAKKAAKKAAKKEAKVEAVELEVVESAPVVEEVVEPVVAEETPAVEVKAAVTPVEGETKVVATEDGEVEEFEEELFDDFDEEKYNEYMDTYEDQYKD